MEYTCQKQASCIERTCRCAQPYGGKDCSLLCAKESCPFARLRALLHMDLRDFVRDSFVAHIAKALSITEEQVVFIR